MTNQIQAEESVKPFMDELMKVIEKHEGSVVPEDMVLAIQSILFTMVFNSAESQEEAYEFLHDSVDDFWEAMDEEGASSEEATE